VITVQHVAAPVVELKSAANETLYLVNTNHSLTCRARGYPTPSVHWSWQPCTTAACSSPRSVWSSVSKSKNIVQVWRIISTSLSYNSATADLPYNTVCTGRWGGPTQI